MGKASSMQAERIKQGCYERVNPSPAQWLLQLMPRSIPPHVPSSPRFPHTCLVHLLRLLPVILVPVGHLHLHMPTGKAQQKRLSSVSNPLLLTPPLLTLPVSTPSQIYSFQVLRFKPDCLWDRGDRCLCMCALCHSNTHGHHHTAPFLALPRACLSFSSRERVVSLGCSAVYSRPSRFRKRSCASGEGAGERGQGQGEAGY